MSIMTPQLALQRFAIDLAKRAGHTFWQAFTATFGVVYAASGLDVGTVTDFSTGQKFLSGLVVAVVAAALSAAKTTLKGIADVRYQPLADAPAEDDQDAALAVALERDPDAELPYEPHDPDQLAAGVSPSTHVPEHATPDR